MSLEKVGNILYKERQKQSLSLKDISNKTCISPVQLEKLEKGQQDLLPARVFVRGFIQAYSKAIHIDSAPLLELYEPEERVLKVSKIANFNKELQPLVTVMNISLAATILFFSGLIFWMRVELNQYQAQVQSLGEEVQKTISTDLLVLPQEFPLNPVVQHSFSDKMERPERGLSSTLLKPKVRSAKSNEANKINKKKDDSSDVKVKNNI